MIENHVVCAGESLSVSIEFAILNLKFETLFDYKIAWWICECVLWIHKGDVVVKQTGIKALWYTV